MSKDKKHVYEIRISDEGLKILNRAAVLLKLDGIEDVVRVAIEKVCSYAEAYNRGNTKVIYCSPELAVLMTNNPEFIEALCEEGVVEWLTPFVLAKSRQGGIAQSTIDTNQP